jgi:diaminopimelate epimerase
MKNIKFYKMVASGNDFVVIKEDSRQITGSASRTTLIKKICDRKYGVGADGLLAVENSPCADARMRIFNPDGSEAEMCGNGARCVALFASVKQKRQRPNLINIETKSGIIASEVNAHLVKIKLTDPRQIKENIPIKINNRTLRVNFINTGVPHAVIFVSGLQKIDLQNLGSNIRYHRIFRPAGANVNFVEAIDNHNIKIRTYERGVEAETLACGTGSVAAALITSCKLKSEGRGKINVHTQGKEILKVYFDKCGAKFFDVWLEGKAACVFKGEIAF